MFSSVKAELWKKLFTMDFGLPALGFCAHMLYAVSVNIALVMCMS